MEAFFFCPSLDGWCSGSVVVECSSSVGQTMRRKISHLLGSSIAASFVRLRLRFWFPFSRSRFSLPLWQCQGFGVLPGCQRLRRRLAPCGEALWPQPLPSSQAPAGNTFLGLVARFSASGGLSPILCLKKTIRQALRLLENLYLCTRLRSHTIMELSVTWEPNAQFIGSLFFVQNERGRLPSAIAPFILTGI